MFYPHSVEGVDLSLYELIDEVIVAGKLELPESDEL